MTTTVNWVVAGAHRPLTEGWSDWQAAGVQADWRANDATYQRDVINCRATPTMNKVLVTR